MSKLQDALLEQYNKLAEYNLLGDSDYISARTDKGMLIIGPDRVVKSVEYGKAEGEDALHLAVYGNTDAAAIVHAHPAYVSAVSRAGATIPAVVDDMSQIVGPTCRTVAADSRKVAKELIKRNSCLIKGDGAITTGRTLDEAFTCMLVLQKASICYVCGSVLGGCKVINGFEARLMRFVYKKKYSKVNTKNKMEQEGNA
ncbi:MAG: class II aldolase/adducin family protein [Clostridia bacterium]|nr:class II aldolase/adducin family protein [Clostridia bacterium]